MNYQYNGHLSEEERIELIATEIVKQYPEINDREAQKIAALEGSISTPCNFDMIFIRLYHIMLIMNQEKEIVRKVYQDLLSYLMESPLTDKFYFYQQVIIEIYRFLRTSMRKSLDEAT